MKRTKCFDYDDVLEWSVTIVYGQWSIHRLSCDRQKKRGKHILSKSGVAENQNKTFICKYHYRKVLLIYFIISIICAPKDIV